MSGKKLDTPKSSNNAVKITKHISKRPKNSKTRYAQHKYENLEMLSEKELIEEQENFLDYVQELQNEAREEQIQVIPISQAKKDAFNYDYKELYLVEHKGEGEDHLHLVYDWDPCQSSIKSFSTQQQEEYKKAYREGRMLEPKRKIYATDRQLEIMKDSLETMLTDGIINKLRLSYIAGFVPNNLTDEMKDLMDKFVKYPPSYCLKLLNIDLPIVVKEFRETHNLPNRVKIQTRPDNPPNQKASLFLTFSSVIDYLAFEKYFIQQKKLEVLILQRYNKTREILNVLRNMYKQELKHIEPEDDKRDTAADNDDDDDDDDDLIQLIENYSGKSIAEIDTKEKKHITIQQKIPMQIEEQIQLDKPNLLDAMPSLDIQETQSPIQEKSLNSKKSKTSPNVDIGLIPFGFNSETVIEDQILQVTDKMELLVKQSTKKIKQTITLNKKQLYIEDLLNLYGEQASYIQTCKLGQQIPDRIILAQFLEKYSIKSVVNYLKTIIKDYKILI